MSKAKNAVLRKKIEGELYDLMVRTNAENVVMDDGRTLTAYLTDFVIAGYVTTTELNERIETILGSAPEAYDTLGEISDWIEEHEDVYKGLISTLSGKVDKVEGKGLSTEDFTTALKTKLESLENYKHPEKHSADMITETNTKQFITAEEKEKLQGLNNVIVSETEPANWGNNDVWMQIIE